jgi:hypothetical protein
MGESHAGASAGAVAYHTTSSAAASASERATRNATSRRRVEEEEEEDDDDDDDDDEDDASASSRREIASRRSSSRGTYGRFSSRFCRFVRPSCGPFAAASGHRAPRAAGRDADAARIEVVRAAVVVSF